MGKILCTITQLSLHLISRRCSGTSTTPTHPFLSFEGKRSSLKWLEGPNNRPGPKSKHTRVTTLLVSRILGQKRKRWLALTEYLIIFCARWSLAGSQRGCRPSSYPPAGGCDETHRATARTPFTIGTAVCMLFRSLTSCHRVLTSGNIDINLGLNRDIEVLAGYESTCNPGDK